MLGSEVLLVGLRRLQGESHVRERAHVVNSHGVGLGGTEILALVLGDVVALALVGLQHNLAAIELKLAVEEVDVRLQVGHDVVLVDVGRSGQGRDRRLLRAVSQAVRQCDCRARYAWRGVPAVVSLERGNAVRAVL